jgi:hypothetical protein
VTPELAVEIQKLGYGALWLRGSRATQRKFIEPVLENTTNWTVVTGLKEHTEAGADHVAINVDAGPDTLLPTLTALSDRLDPATDVPG